MYSIKPESMKLSSCFSLPSSAIFIKVYLFVLIFSQISVYGFSQRVGYTDDFENGSLEFTFRNNQGNRPPFIIWGTETPGTYKLLESEGVLKIGYERKEGFGAFDHFTFYPFRGISVQNNPRIQVDVKSDIDIKLTVSPTYSEEPPTYEFIEMEIPGDNNWKTYTVEMTKPWFEKKEVSAVDFYFDRGSADAKTGNIKLDNFRMAWYLIHITDLTLNVIDGNNIHLSWGTSNIERTAGYKIYRSTEQDFKPGEENLIAETDTTFFVDEKLDPYKVFFYKVAAVGNNEEEYFAPPAVKGETFIKGKLPEVSVLKVNTEVVKKYEKFELILGLNNVGIENPYDPADIDVYSIFTTPSGKKIRINGFYNNFQDQNNWKLRFSPNETGEYKYQVFVNDAGGTGESAISDFTVIDSEHHGWIRPSKNNKHYFQHDDGTSYYAVGVYSPWRNDQQRFETFAKYDANLFAIWDITYGGFVNGYGLIEEELGRYNQEKLGRIDSMLTILEKDDIKLMYAIWPHDLFSETVWAAQWKQNPYSQLIDVEDVYSDSLVWEYQKRKYRYMIARFAHSRSWGIWELINEMNGTDGWAAGRHQECYDWVERCQKYFSENDPYQHPMTASFSGGYSEYREPLYERNEIPNIHMYPAQGWPMKYPEDKLRSAMYNYAWASKRFWAAYEKPAIFGEAGANLAYFQPSEPEYHVSYHNQIWACLTNGLAGIPVWWDYPVMNEQDWQGLQHLSRFVSDIDFANLPFTPAKVSADEADVFIMDSGEIAFGWLRTYASENCSGTKITIDQKSDGSYSVEWYDTWSGETLQKETIIAKNSSLVVSVPTLKAAHPDIAFKFSEVNRDAN